MLELPYVSLVVIATGDYCHPAREVASVSCGRAKFANEVVFTENPLAFQAFPKNPAIIQIPPLTRREDISIFHLTQLPKYAAVLADHILLIQWDGYVVNPEAWTDEFLEYDYIGAPWDNGEVGNDGFCLLSKRLLEMVDDLRLEPVAEHCYPSDGLLCRESLVERDWRPDRPTYRKRLEEMGAKFAPVELARRFSAEEEAYCGSFGFHGGPNLIAITRMGLNLSGVKYKGSLPKPLTLPDNPHSRETLLKAAVEAHSDNDLAVAEKLYRIVLSRNPTDAEVLLNLADLLCMDWRFDEAIDLAEQGVALRPDEAVYHAVLARAYHGAWDDRATDEYERTLQLAPYRVSTMWFYALWLLLNEDFERGWECYQWRRAQIPYQRIGWHEWSGGSLIGIGEKPKLLVTTEQGFGDLMMFCRLLKPLREREPDVEIILEVEPGLVPLFTRFDLADRVIATQKDRSWPWKEPASWVSLYSLPCLLGLTPNTLPPPPYITAPAPVKLSKEALHVGVCWTGDDRNPVNSVRSMPPEAFTALADLTGVHWHCLQMGHETPAFPLPWKSFTKVGTSWRETANKIAGLDLVVTVETAVAHLAGAMGVSTALLLSKCADWRWGRNRSTALWYPNTSLLRQQEEGDWAAPLAQARMTIQHLLDQK